MGAMNRYWHVNETALEAGVFRLEFRLFEIRFVERPNQNDYENDNNVRLVEDHGEWLAVAIIEYDTRDFCAI